MATRLPSRCPHRKWRLARIDAIAMRPEGVWRDFEASVIQQDVEAIRVVMMVHVI